MIKTQLTAHTVLMHKKRFVKGIMASGLVDEKEGYEMADMVNIKVKDMLFKPLRPDVSKPEVRRSPCCFSLVFIFGGLCECVCVCGGGGGGVHDHLVNYFSKAHSGCC